MSELLKETQLTRDTDFRDRVEAAMARTAIDVANESEDHPNHDQRMSLVRTFFGAIESDRHAYINAMVRRVVQNPTIRSTATAGEDLDQSDVPDADIAYVVNGSWDAVAGVQ